MKWVWIDLDWNLSGGISDYPTSLSRDSLAASLAMMGITLTSVTPPDVEREGLPCYQVWMFSAVTCQWPKCCRLAKIIRKRMPDAILIVGGYHVSALPNNKGTELFDYVVIGEGETIIEVIVREVMSKNAHKNKRSHQILKSSRCELLDCLPWPVRIQREYSAFKLGGLMYPSPLHQRAVVALLLSRGCNSQCSFCASHTIWGSRLITRNIDCILSEMQYVTKDLGANALVLVDQALGEDPAWTKELCSRLYQTQLNVSWYCMAKPTLDLTLIPDMAKAGCTKIGFGVETADSNRQMDLNRPENGDLDHLNRTFRKCNEAGIIVKIYFMIGFPWETPEYLERTTKQFLGNLEANELKITFFTPFPGTQDWGKYSNQLLTREWQYFDTETMPVVKNTHISVPQYHDFRKELLRTFYSSQTYFHTSQRLLRNRPHYTSSYVEFSESLKTNGIITGNETWVKKLGIDGSMQKMAAEVA